MDISLCQNYEELDEEKAMRSIVVSNFPPEFGGEKLFIHFQKQRNGGGEIERLCMVEQENTAVITYEEADVARRVLGKEQICENSGENLKVQAFEVVRPPEPPEVFYRVSARLNWEIFRSNGILDSQKLLRRVAAETEVDWHEACDGYIISGTFEQLQNANQELNKLLRRSVLQNPELRLHSSSKDGVVATNVGTENGHDSLEENQQQQDDEDILEELPPLDVEPRFMTFIHDKYSEAINEMEKMFSVHFVWPLNGENTKVSIKAATGCKKREYNDASNKFFEFYKTLFSNVKQEVVLYGTNGPEEVKRVLDLVNSADVLKSIFIEEGDKVLVYGEKQSVDLVLKIIKCMHGKGQNISTRRIPEDGSVVEGNVEKQEESMSPIFSQGYPSRLQQVLTNGVRVSVYQGDITNHSVDVIVNAADGWLSHTGGLAKAIQKKGGDQILAESQFIIRLRQGCPLSVGEAVYTRGGNLPCSLVIHAVGPVWRKQSDQNSALLLHKTVISSLRLAASCNSRSIALPAISSGNHGMPLEVCATAMFDAVQEYSESIEARHSPLCDISFVNIDLPTVNAFKQEFVKRFKEGTPVASTESQLQVAETRSDFKFYDQETFSSMPTSYPSKYQHKKLQLQSAQISNSNDGKQTTTPPISLPDITTNSYSFPSQNVQMSASLPPFSAGQSHTAKPVDQRKEIVESSTLCGETTQSISTPATDKGDKDQPKVNRTDRGVNKLKVIGRGRANIAANFVSSSTPGTAMRVSIDTHGTNHGLNSQNVHKKDVKPLAANSLGTNVEATCASTTPSERSKNSSSEIARNEYSSEHGENLALTARMNSTREEKETKIDSEMNIPKQTQTPIDRPKTEQKHNEHSSETANGDNKIEGENSSFSAEDGTQTNTVGGSISDFKERLFEKSTSKTEQSVHFKKGNAITEEKTLMSHLKSSLLVEKDEAPENRSKQMKVSEPKSAESPILPEQKEQSKEESVIEIKNHQLLENGHSTKEDSKISPKTEEETDSCKDSALDDIVTVPDDNVTFNDCSNGSVDSEDNKKGVLQRSKNDETLEDVNRNIETTSDVTNNSPWEATSVSGSKHQEGSMMDNKEEEEKEMPPLSDCSEEDNNIVLDKTQLESGKDDSSEDQPFGSMKCKKDVRHLPGYPKCDTIVIKYSFPEGKQGPKHPNPGQPYVGYDYEAFLPDSTQGREVLELLKTAFKKKELFTLKSSNLASEPAQIVLGDIPHKTSRTGGRSKNGYPDSTYLDEVKAKLLEYGHSSLS